MVALDGLRTRLGKMTERILLRLEDRSGFPLNRPVYEVGAVPIAGREGISFLDFAIEGLEAYHASLGRYEYPDQHSLSQAELPGSAARRQVHIPALPRVEINVRDALVPFYRDTILPQLCVRGDDDPDTYGETVYVDADLLELLHERINLGRYVARAKFESGPGIRNPDLTPEELTELLRDRPQEERILAGVRVAAERYGVNTDVAAQLFGWVIEQTIRVEVAWLRGLPPASLGR
ncbi:MAG: hypothetical protein WEB13_03915 [Dehalococcoidia bacterium]